MNNDIARELEKLADELGEDRKRSIGDVAKELKVETHVIRFWEEKFPQIRPEIGAGKRRYYYNKQLRVLKRIKQFLYEEGYTIAGLQKLLKKRKHNEYKDEDLDLILSAEIARNSQDNFDLDDFIVDRPVEKMSDESKTHLSKRIESAKENLNKLKSLLVQIK